MKIRSKKIYLMSKIVEFIKKHIIRFVENRGYLITRKTKRDELEQLISQLHPIKADKGLIRIGPNGDGGYLLPDDLDGINACFSAGIGFTSLFELDLARSGLKIFLADKSVDGPAENHELFTFTKSFIGARSNKDFIRLDDWVSKSGLDEQSELILKMDIEGAEYETFISVTSQLLKRFRIIIVEFHGLHNLWNKPYFSLASVAFNRILENHKCVHIHPNNVGAYSEKDGIAIAEIMEFTFIRKDRIHNAEFEHEFPNVLDYDNSVNRPVVLPSNWHGS